MNHVSISARASDGKRVRLAVRRQDGYVDVSLLCEDQEKKWSDYRDELATQELIKELRWVSGTQAALTQKDESSNQLWVHPQIAMDLARWISPRVGTIVADLCLRFRSGVFLSEHTEKEHKAGKGESASESASEHAATEAETRAKVEPVQSKLKKVPGVFGVDKTVPATDENILQDRMDSIAITNAKHQMLAKLFPEFSPAEYAVLGNISNQIALSFRGVTTTRFKTQNGIKGTVADYMDSAGLSRRMLAEAGMGLWIKQNALRLRQMSFVDRKAAYIKQQECLQVEVDRVDSRKPQLLSPQEADRVKRELVKLRKFNTIRPSLKAILFASGW